ncbi:hypothetical protein PENANT_c124G03772 [Penicillium antarcticum]|uniref:Uncharacterized protein n=1 Tax=Penicillium antarcticum TaxID=416450 RepID=A0A1V6PIM7_9EURO|nr:hypothetical protein PENANT_c124G03772 [Penicillium antarcticum]
MSSTEFSVDTSFLSDDTLHEAYELEVQSKNGEPVRFGELVAGKGDSVTTVVIFVRHFFCIYDQDYQPCNCAAACIKRLLRSRTVFVIISIVLSSLNGLDGRLESTSAFSLDTKGVVSLFIESPKCSSSDKAD